MVGTDVEPADVVAHDDEDVWFAVGRLQRGRLRPAEKSQAEHPSRRRRRRRGLENPLNSLLYVWFFGLTIHTFRGFLGTFHIHSAFEFDQSPAPRRACLASYLCGRTWKEWTAGSRPLTGSLLSPHR